MEITQYNIGELVVNKTNNVMCWRLVHDGKKVISLSESSGITQTIHTIFLANTKQECETEIYSLNLEYNP